MFHTRLFGLFFVARCTKLLGSLVKVAGRVLEQNEYDGARDGEGSSPPRVVIGSDTIVDVRV